MSTPPDPGMHVRVARRSQLRAWSPHPVQDWEGRKVRLGEGGFGVVFKVGG